MTKTNLRYLRCLPVFDSVNPVRLALQLVLVRVVLDPQLLPAVSGAGFMFIMSPPHQLSTLLTLSGPRFFRYLKDRGGGGGFPPPPFPSCRILHVENTPSAHVLPFNFFKKI